MKFTQAGTTIIPKIGRAIHMEFIVENNWKDCELLITQLPELDPYL
jgi:hypothetical protein